MVDRLPEKELRRKQMLDECLRTDLLITRGDWRLAYYHWQTVGNLILAEILEEETEAMRRERDEYETPPHLKLIE